VYLTRHAAVLLAVPLLVAAAGCASDGKADVPDDGRLQVVTTVAPLTSIAATIGGDKVAVTGIVPEGTNSHTFEPSPKVARVLEKADVVLVNGLQLEEPTLELAEANVPKGAAIVEVGTRVLPQKDWIFDFSFPRKDGRPNPHLWTDPTYAIRYAQVIADAFATKDPANAATYEGNRAAFTRRATALSDALRADQATIPGGKRELLTYHDAYAYFAKTYGWTVIGAVQPSNFEDPQPKEVARIIDQIRARHVTVVFGSEVFPSKVLAQIARETGARYEDTLRDDDLPGEPGDATHSWLGLMRYDFRTMVTALGGTATHLDALDVADVAPDKADYPQ
jgi:ABC-type Zn uptake system ZnuABC Zn-binding protein ZnuA